MSTNILFILGSGRSGTTLIQRLLNSYEDTIIWGEHAGFLKTVSDQYFLLRDSKSMEEFSYSLAPKCRGNELINYYKNPELWQAWINSYSKNDLLDIFREHIENFFNINESVYSTWGFKEIRYYDDRVVEFLKELYPSAKFVIVTRNGFNTIESQVTTFYRGESKFLHLKRLLQLPLIFKLGVKWAKQNTNNYSLLITEDPQIVRIIYEKAITNRQYLDEVFNKLGKKIGDKQLEILGMAEGRGSGILDDTDEQLRWQRLGVIPYMMLRLVIGGVNRKLGY